MERLYLSYDLTDTINYNIQTPSSMREVLCMYQFRYIRGHVEVYDCTGTFLFSADNMREANEMLEE